MTIVVTGSPSSAWEPNRLGSYHSIAPEFPKFVDDTRHLPTAQRVALFRHRFAALFPGFYEPADGRNQREFDTTIVRALNDFPALRARYATVEREFPSAYARGVTHFRQQFPKFKMLTPVWLVHSLGQMDGGTRTIRGRDYLVFGADVIAQIHDRNTVGPLFDHELFHVENSQWFKDCKPGTTIWCSLWQEGSATYTVSIMNPGASDQMLLLDNPRPIRQAVDARWREALCRLSADLDKKDEHTYASYFYANDKITGSIVPRWGYYVGYRMMQRLGKRYSLAQIDHFSNARAKSIVQLEMAQMVKEAGGCPKPV